MSSRVRFTVLSFVDVCDGTIVADEGTFALAIRSWPMVVSIDTIGLVSDQDALKALTGSRVADKLVEPGDECGDVNSSLRRRLSASCCMWEIWLRTSTASALR